jgi:MFS transporter, ACS family, tartrate transporter
VDDEWQFVGTEIEPTLLTVRARMSPERTTGQPGDRMNQGPQPDDATGRSAMAKAMWRILPLILLAYVVAYIDRVNVSFASLQMNDDLKFSATIYGLGGGLFFLGYALFEVPSSLMLTRFKAPQWIARIMITWGLLAVGMMFVHTPLQFYVMRFLLGVAEAGFFPSVIYYFGGWFPMACRGRAVSRIYVASSLASVVMGGISGTLLGLDGTAGLRGWQWLFLVQGLPAVLLGLFLLRFLPDAPATVHWLADREKAWIHRELARDAALIGTPERHSLLAAFANPTVLLLGATGLLLNGSGNGLLLSAPAVLAAGTGLDTLRVGSLVSLGGGLGVVCIVVAGWNSDRNGDRLRDASACAVLCAAALLLIGVASAPALVVVGYLLFSATFFTGGMLLVSSWADLLHVRQLAVGSAAINTLWQIGAFLSPYAWGVTKDATGSFRTGLIGASGLAMVGALVILYVRSRAMSERRERAAALEQPLAVPL